MTITAHPTLDSVTVELVEQNDRRLMLLDPDSDISCGVVTDVEDPVTPIGIGGGWNSGTVWLSLDEAKTLMSMLGEQIAWCEERGIESEGS
jgi:hypothetical protein